MRADMCIPCGLLFMWGVAPRFLFRVLGAASQEKPDFGTLKMEKSLFMGRNQNRLLWRSSPSQGPRTCLIWTSESSNFTKKKSSTINKCTEYTNNKKW
jgi:hypothetical protein